jgi:hypothetical protein
MDWGAAMLTADRKQPTIDGSLLSANVAGWENVLVSPETGGGIGVNFFDALRELGVRERYIVFQDDVHVAMNLRPYLDRFWPDDADVLWLYTSSKSPIAKAAKGWYQLGADKRTRVAYGALAVAMRPAVVEAILLSDLDKHKAGFDARLSPWLVERFAVWQHCPGFVQHTGRTSVLHPGLALSPSRRARGDWIRDADDASETNHGCEMDGRRADSPEAEANAVQNARLG